MRKFFLPLVIVASLGASSVAMAATSHTSVGVLKALDAKACTVTLGKSTIYHFAAKCDFSTFKVGEKVKITWHVYHKANWATKMVAN